MSKIFTREMSKKRIMSVDGSAIGTLSDIVIDLKTGMLVDIVVKPDISFDTTGYRTEGDYIFFPFDSVKAIKDYIMLDKSMH
jgi:sporulation protein YlmC with PRC-barrel domain